MIFAFVAAAGAALRLIGGIQQARGARQEFQIRGQIEDVREKQMRLEAQRGRREQIRQMITARSVAVANATNQGAGKGTGILGGVSQVTANASRNINDINQNESIGAQIFQLNKKVGGAMTTQATGAGLSSLGESLMSNAEGISRIGGGG